jgi:3-phenylpropionate/trans-cinnamate dioxygenase ferredoxin component
MSSWMLAAETSEIAEGGRKSLVVDEIPALLIRAGDRYYCIEDQCTHDSQPLTDGKIVDGCIVCPRHGAKFDLATGAAMCMPANEPVRTFPVEVRASGIFVNESP